MNSNVIQLRPTVQTVPVKVPSKPLKRSRTFRKYEAILTGKAPLSKSDILGLAWALNGIKKVNLTAEDRADLHNLLDSKRERRIVKELSDFGIDWLLRKAFRLDGKPRKSCPFDTDEQAIIRDFSHFTFVGYRDLNENPYSRGNGWHQFTAIYRVYDKRGQCFDYFVGGNGFLGGFEIHVL